MSGPVTTAMKLAAIGAVCAALVAASYRLTREPIAEQIRLKRAATLAELVSPDDYDNDPWRDAVPHDRSELLGHAEPFSVPRATHAGSLVATFVPVRALDGYAGPIELLVAINRDGSVRGVRVVRHQETPGIGDAIEPRRSSWLQQFTERSLTDPAVGSWAVTSQPGGGEPAFDALSNATITSQAVVKAIRNALVFHQEQHAAPPAMNDHE